MLIAQKMMIVRIPGPTVDRKQARTFVLVTQPKMIIGVEGGISVPRIDEAVISAVAQERG